MPAYPTRDELLVDLAVLVDVEVAHFLLLGLAGRKRPQRRAAVFGHWFRLGLEDQQVEAIL